MSPPAVIDVAAAATGDFSAIAVLADAVQSRRTSADRLRRGPVYRDVGYEGVDLLVELDGRLHHTRVRDRDGDLERDLDAAVDERLTVRLWWGQAVDRPCVTAMKMARLLQQRGWTGSPGRCHNCDVDLEPPGDPKSTLSA